MNTAIERPRICKNVVLSENLDRSECLTKENMFILFLSCHLYVKMLKFLGNDLYKIQIPIGIHSKIYTFFGRFSYACNQNTCM